VNGQPFEIAGNEKIVRDLEITLDSLSAGEPAPDDGGGPRL
jgi:hypothetical protein